MDVHVGVGNGGGREKYKEYRRRGCEEVERKFALCRNNTQSLLFVEVYSSVNWEEQSMSTRWPLYILDLQSVFYGGHLKD